jgi:predicted DNA-binding transcriptional regulator AlpA
MDATTNFPTSPKPATVKPRSNPAGNLPVSGYVRQSQLIPTILPFSSATLWRMVKKGRFPAPIKLSERVTAWSAEHVRQYLANPTGYRAPEVK